MKLDEKVAITRLKVVEAGVSLDEAALDKRKQSLLAQVRRDLQVHKLMVAELVYEFFTDPTGLYIEFHLQLSRQGTLFYGKETVRRLFEQDVDNVYDLQSQLYDVYHAARDSAKDPSADPELAARRRLMAEARREGKLSIPSGSEGEDFTLDKVPEVQHHSNTYLLRFVVETLERTQCHAILREVVTPEGADILARQVGKRVRLRRMESTRGIEAGRLLLVSLEKSAVLQATAQVELRWDDGSIKYISLTDELELV